MAIELYKKKFNQLSNERLKKWQAIPTSVIGDSLNRQHVMSSRIKPLHNTKIVGQAQTVTVVAGDNGPVHAAMSIIEPSNYSDMIKTLLIDYIQNDYINIKNIIELIENPKKLTEEVLRYATPLHMFTRYFTTDVSLFGHNFKSGDKIGLLLGAANRDPNHFDFPENFNPFITRKTNLSLGAGLHFCLGAHLARLELEIAFTNIIKKFPKITIAAKPTYSDTYHFYRLNELIVKT